MYNYLYFNISLKKMSPSARNNIDEWVYDCLKNKNIDHIPIKRVRFECIIHKLI
jgi:hypothetical protein